jgi:hypothetical protein
MEVVHARCAGLDISKKDAKVCVRVHGSGSRKTQATVTTWGAMTNDILRLRDKRVLIQQINLAFSPTSLTLQRPRWQSTERCGESVGGGC